MISIELNEKACVSEEKRCEHREINFKKET